jgi:hypothetical protein
VEQAVRDAPASPVAPPRSEVAPTPGAATEAPAPGKQVVAGAPATPAQLSQPVQLAGKSHALSLKRVGDQLQVWLCSNGCGELIAKLEAMIGRLPADHAARTELESLLQRVPREATQIDQDVMQKLASDLEDIQSRHPGVVNPDIPVAPAPSAVDPLADTGGVPEPIPPEQAGEITGRLANPRPVGNLTLTEGQQIIGEYIVTGERRLVGDTLEWDIPGLSHIGGPTLDIRPIREFRDLLIQDAQAAGATTLRIRGAAIRNMNVVRVRRFAEEVGGTAQGYIDEATGLGSNEIIIPVPPRE